VTARLIGEITAPLVERAQTMAGFQAMLRRCPTSHARKGLILAAYDSGAIDEADARLLIEAEGLETA